MATDSQVGTVEYREARRARDRINPNQHRFADAARATYGNDMTFTIVAWDFKPPDEGTTAM